MQLCAAWSGVAPEHLEIFGDIPTRRSGTAQVAWRAAPPALGAQPGSWLRLRCSVTSALIPEVETHRRAAVVVHAWLLEPKGDASTKVTIWGAAELPLEAPDWLKDAANEAATKAAPSFSERLSKYMYLDDDAPDPIDLPVTVPDAWLAEETAAKAEAEAEKAAQAGGAAAA